ncbi:MAG TPA: hypothetical protein PL065_02205 [Polyangiaceae bacterium]|nr:hypothetical protein [Polyangiaceae bacterium]
MPSSFRHPQRFLKLFAYLTLVGATACSGYEPPCSTEPSTWIVDESLEEQAPFFPSLEPNDRGTLVASWLMTPLAQTSHAGALRDSVVGVAILSQEGRLLERYAFPLFEGWEDDDLPHDNFGFCFSPYGLVLRWTRMSTLSAVGDPPRIRTSLWVQRIFRNGRNEPPYSPANMNCEQCVVQLSGACRDGFASVLFSALPEPSQGSADEPEILVFSWDLAATRSTSGPLAWLDATPTQASAPYLLGDEKSLWLLTQGQGWPIDAEFRKRAGPIPLPLSNQRFVHFSPSKSETWMTWSVASDGKDQQDVFFRRFDKNGVPSTPLARLGEASFLASVARSQGELGAVLRNDGDDYFAWADDRGVRMGGDVPLGPADQVLSGGIRREWLMALGGGRFVRLQSFPNRLQRTEIWCER